MKPITHILRYVKDSDPISMSDQQGQKLVEILPIALRDQNKVSFPQEVSTALGRYLAIRASINATHLMQWRSMLVDAKKAAEELISRIELIASDPLLRSYLAKMGEIAEGDYLRRNPLATLALEREPWQETVFAPRLCARLKNTVLSIDYALQEVPPTKKNRPLDFLSRLFVRDMAYVWFQATGRVPPKTTPSASAPEGGPFARFATCANQMLPPGTRIANVPHWCKRVAKEDAAFWAHVSSKTGS